MVLENTAMLAAEPECTDLYIASLGEKAEGYVPVLAAKLRADGVKTEYDLMGRGLKAQMKYADKCGARFSAVIGDDELEKGEVSLKNMTTGESAVCTFSRLAEAVLA